MKEYIARISYGKDSMKMLDVIRSRGLPLDRITTTDVWATDTISANLPPVEAFKAKMDDWIWTHYRIDVEHLCARNRDGSKRTYEQMFYHVPTRREKEGGRFNHEDIRGFQCTECHGAKQSSNDLSDYRVQGSIKGFPGTVMVKWCQKLKHVWVPDIFSDEPGTTGKDRNIVEYLGIAADEPKRFGQLNDKKRAPLVEFGIEEKLCGLYCRYAGCLSPTYETSFRDGCWFCHNQSVGQLRLLRKNYPNLWALLLKWDKDSPVSFKSDGHTVHDFDERFRLEDEKMIDPKRPFRWDMLDAELQMHFW